MANRPKWVLWLSILFVLWNLMGLASFTMQWMMTPADMAKLPADQQELWGKMPGWMWAAYVVAVGAGTLGSIGLLLGKKWATSLFLLSLFAIAIQFSMPLLHALDRNLMPMMVFPAFIFIAGLVEWLTARSWTSKGWLK